MSECALITRDELKNLKPYERLNLLIDKFGSSGAEVARVAGLTPASISRIRGGQIEGTAYSWKKIADAFGLPMDWFFS